jgi:hypothetical protein
MLMFLFAGSSSTNAAPECVDLSDKEDDMDWSDNMAGIKDLYEEGLALAAGKKTPEQAEQMAGGGQRPPEGLAAATAPAAAGNTGTEPAAAAQHPQDGPSGGGGVKGSTEPEPEKATDRAKAFLAKAKNAAIERIQEELGDKYLSYAAILAARRKDMATPHLLGGKTEEMPDVGSFLSNGDGRILKAHFEVNLGQRRVISYSFNPNTMQCKCPGPHSIRKIASGRGEKKSVREAIILSDQAYPATLPSGSDKLCISFIRIEHGMLHEMAEVLENVLRGRYLEAGSLVMMFSATNLAVAGMVGYCADLVGAFERLKHSIGEHVVFTPAPHFFGGGCKDGATVRAAVEVGAWSIHVFGKELCHMKNSFETANDILASSGYGGIVPDQLERYRLPTADRRYTTWVSGGMTELPMNVSPASQANEERYFGSVIAEIRSGLAIDLDPTPSFERGVGPCLAAAAVGGTLVIGSSNAKRLHKAMIEDGWVTDLVYEPNLRISKKSVLDLTDKLKDKIKAKRPDNIVLQIIDSSVYCSLTEEGFKQPMEKIDNRYHAIGDLVLADKHSLAKILAMCKPLLDAAGDINTVVIGPLPRYATGGCCDSKDHMQNRKKPNFLDTMLADLAVLNRSIKDFLFSENYRGARAMDPWIGLREKPVSSLWGADPVHVRQEHFGPLVEGVKLTLAKISSNGNVRKRQAGTTNSDQKRGRTDGGQGYSGRTPGRGGRDQSWSGRRGSY